MIRRGTGIAYQEVHKSRNTTKVSEIRKQIKYVCLTKTNYLHQRHAYTAHTYWSLTGSAHMLQSLLKNSG